jgi:hypothetical protein
MPNTGERREITSRVNAREAETDQEVQDISGKNEASFEVADTKSRSRRNEELGGPSGALKNKP